MKRYFNKCGRCSCNFTINSPNIVFAHANQMEEKQSQSNRPDVQITEAVERRSIDGIVCRALKPVRSWTIHSLLFAKRLEYQSTCLQPIRMEARRIAGCGPIRMRQANGRTGRALESSRCPERDLRSPAINTAPTAVEITPRKTSRR